MRDISPPTGLGFFDASLIFVGHAAINAVRENLVRGCFFWWYLGGGIRSYIACSNFASHGIVSIETIVTGHLRITDVTPAVFFRDYYCICDTFSLRRRKLHNHNRRLSSDTCLVSRSHDLVKITHLPMQGC